MDEPHADERIGCGAGMLARNVPRGSIRKLTYRAPFSRNSKGGERSAGAPAISLLESARAGTGAERAVLNDVAQSFVHASAYGD